TFGLVVVPAPGVTLQEAEDAMDAAVAAFLSKGVDPDQLERLKFQLRAQDVYARDDVSRLANVYGRALTSGLTVADVQAWPDILQSVTAEDIIAAGSALLSDRRGAVTGWLMAPTAQQDTPQQEDTQ
ncbi:MAG: insulinase family protein, partial [Paracoccaceae bacterium]